MLVTPFHQNICNLDGRQVLLKHIPVLLFSLMIVGGGLYLYHTGWDDNWIGKSMTNGHIFPQSNDAEIHPTGKSLHRHFEFMIFKRSTVY